MGGYGSFVWSSMAIFAGAMLIDYVGPKLRHRRALKDLQARFKRQQKRQEPSA